MKKRKKNKILKTHLLLTFITVLALCSAAAVASISIPGNTSIGIWDEASRTYTLTTDVNEPIIVSESDLTLDGNDFTVTGTGILYGVLISGVKKSEFNIIWKENINVVNFNITNFGSGISTLFCRYINIENNTISNCARGIMFGDESNSNTVTGNSISQCDTQGIYLNDSKNNVFSNNVLFDNLEAVNIIDYSINNLFYQNNFINNNETVTMMEDCTGNDFNLSAPDGGNYWDDYTGVDEDNDGFGDTPYTTQPYGYVLITDYLPWMVENGWSNQPPVADAGSDQTIHIGVLVTLDGSASSDPDENYPLSYSWSIIEKPEDSNVALIDPNTQSPMFLPDAIGDYVVSLTVTDSLGLESEPDTVLVSTFNTPPVADAGLDQAVILLGTEVQLDGSASYDNEDDPMTYFWSIIQKPETSAAELSDQYSVNPSFIADVHGDYVIELIVSDPWDSSAADSVNVSFNNVIPVAEPGEGQSVIVGDTVYLDGSESYDENLDPLAFDWSFVIVPEDSTAELNNPTSTDPNFVADVPGEYIVSLIVNDGFEDSEAVNVSIMAISYQDAASEALRDAIDAIRSLPRRHFKHRMLKRTLIRRINLALRMIDRKRYAIAWHILRLTVLPRMDGCAEHGHPDRRDWITTCEGQELVYPPISEAIGLLEDILIH
jgi:parallel beta-helix repeat protein